MEEKNSKSIDCELDPITNSNSSPPNEVTALVSNPDPPNRCSLDFSKKFSFLKKHWQHLCASILLAVFFITTSIGLIYAATSVGSGHGQGIATYGPGGGTPGFEVAQVVAYMITPMKLFPYEPVYTNASIEGSEGNYAGSKMLIQGGKVGDYKLKDHPESYYGNTISGASKGSTIFIPWYNSSSAYTHADWARKFTSYTYNGDKLVKANSPALVVFDSGDASNSVNVGDKDPDVEDGTKHVYTKALYECTDNSYDTDKLRKNIDKVINIAKKSSYKQNSYKLWAYISTPEGSNYTPKVRDRINDYISPANTDKWRLKSNASEDDESSMTLQHLKKKNKPMYQVTCYHIVDLLFTLYSVSGDDEWLNVARKYIEGWADPSSNTGNVTLVYDALSITPAVAFASAKSGDSNVVVGLGDYIDFTLKNKSTALVSQPKTANTLEVTKNSDMCHYMFNLMEAAVKSSGNEASGMKHFAKHSGDKMTLGDLSLFLNVFGFRPTANSGGSGKFEIKWKDNGDGRNVVYFQLNSDIWGSNLVFFPSTQLSSKEALPQFAVNLGRSSVTKDLTNKDLDKDPIITVPAKLNKGSGGNSTASMTDDQLRLEFEIDYKIDKVDDYLQQEIDAKKRKLRDKDANKLAFERSLTGDKLKDLTLSFKVRRVVDTTDLKRVGSSEAGKYPNKIAFDEKNPEMKKANGEFKSDSMKKAKSNTTYKHLETKGISESLKTATDGLDDVVRSNLKDEVSDATLNHGVKHKTNDNYQYSDFWISYTIPDLSSDKQTYRYGLLASALGGSAAQHLFSTAIDKTIEKYGVYVKEGEEKYLPVTYKITEAYLAFKEDNDLKKEINNDEKEKKFQPYATHDVFVDGSVKNIPAIRAAYTGDAVSVIYKFVEAPSLDLTIDASVGSLLELTESGSATNPKETGIEDIDVKLGTPIGYVKEDSSSSSEATISDVPAVFVGVESNFDWDKYFKKRQKTGEPGLILTFFVKRTLTSEGTLPKNAEQVPFHFNCIPNNLRGFPGTNEGFKFASSFSDKAVISVSGGFNGVPIVPAKDGPIRAPGTNGVLGNTSSPRINDSYCKFRGSSVSKITGDENPGLEQMAVFSIKVDDSKCKNTNYKNDKKLASLFKKTAPMIGDIEAPDENTEKPGDIKLIGTGKRNTKGVNAKGDSLDPRNNTLFTILDYSMAELYTEGFTDVTATYSVSVNLSFDNTRVVGAPNAATVASAPSEAESDPDSSDSAATDDDALPKASVTYYPAGPRLITLDAAVDTKDTVPSEDYLAPDCTNVAVKEEKQKSKHSDSKGDYYRKAHVPYKGSGTTINDYPTLWLGSDKIDELIEKIGPLDSSKKSYRAVVYRDGETVASTSLQSEGDLESAKLISLLQAAQSKKTQLKNITPSGSTGTRMSDSTDPASDILVLRDKSIASIPIGENETKEFVYTMALEVIDLATTKTTTYKTNSVKVIYTSRPLEPDYLTELDGWVNVPGYEGQKKAEIPPENVDNGAIGDVPDIKLTIVGSEWAKDWKILIDDSKVKSVKVTFVRTPSGGSPLDLGDGDLPISSNTVSLSKGSSGFNAVMEALQNKTEGEFVFKDKSIQNYPAAWSTNEDGDEEFQATFTYSAKVVISYETSSGVKDVAHDTNTVTLVYHSAKNKVINANMSFSTKVRNYAELKEGYVDVMDTFAVHENYEAMAGVPSTQKLYFSAGGNQFIVDINLQTVSNGKVNRYYRSYFAGTDCEFKAHDQLRAMSNVNRTAGEFNVNRELAHYTKLIPGELAGHYTQSDDQAKGNGYVQYSNIAIMKFPESLTGKNKTKINYVTAGKSSSQTYEEPYKTTSDKKSIGASDIALSSGDSYGKLVNSLGNPTAEGKEITYKTHYGSINYSDALSEDYLGIAIQDHNTATPVKMVITGEIENESKLNPGDNGSNYTSALGVSMGDGSATTIDSTNDKDKKYGIGGETYKESVTVNYTTQVAKSTKCSNNSKTDELQACPAAGTYTKEEPDPTEDDPNHKKTVTYCSDCNAKLEGGSHYNCAKDGSHHTDGPHTYIKKQYEEGDGASEPPIKQQDVCVAGTISPVTYYAYFGTSIPSYNWRVPKSPAPSDDYNYRSWEQKNGSWGEWNWANAGFAKYDRGDIEDLGKAYDKALAWAKKVSQASNTSDGNVWKKSNSDNKQRIYHAGQYRIRVVYQGSAAGKNNATWEYNNYSGNVITLNAHGNTYTETNQHADLSENLSSVMSEFAGGHSDRTAKMREGEQNIYTNNDYRSFWGCGFFDTGGSYTGTAYVNDYQTYSGPKVPHVAADGKQTPYSDQGVWNYTEDPDSPSNNTLNAAELGTNGNWRIEVTFYNGYIESKEANLDTGTKEGTTGIFYYNQVDTSGRTSAKQKTGPPYAAVDSTTLYAHALCGPCCSHDLIAIEDRWRQEIQYDTVTIEEMHVWKIDSAIINGMHEILYTQADDVVSAEVNNDAAQPNIFFNIAEKESSLGGRLRYSYDTKSNDIVQWSEYRPTMVYSPELAPGVIKEAICKHHDNRNKNAMVEDCDEDKQSRTPWCDGYYQYWKQGTGRYGLYQRPLQTVTDKGHNYSYAEGILFTTGGYENSALPNKLSGYSSGPVWDNEILDSNGKPVNSASYLHKADYRIHGVSGNKTQYDVRPDSKDLKTQEWVRFLYRRGAFCDTKNSEADDTICKYCNVNSANVVSDFLILGTKDYDEAVVYASVRAGGFGDSENNEVLCAPEDDVDARIHTATKKEVSKFNLGDFFFRDGANESDVTDGAATYTRYSAINSEETPYAGYNGNFIDLDTKYVAESNAPNGVEFVNTLLGWSLDGGGFADPAAKNSGITISQRTGKVTSYPDPAPLLQAKLGRPIPLQLTVDTADNPYEAGNIYRTEDSGTVEIKRHQNRIARPTAILSLVTNGLAQSIGNPNGAYETGYAGVYYRSVADYLAKPKKYQKFKDFKEYVVKPVGEDRTLNYKHAETPLAQDTFRYDSEPESYYFTDDYSFSAYDPTFSPPVDGEMTDNIMPVEEHFEPLDQTPILCNDRGVSQDASKNGKVSDGTDLGSVSLSIEHLVTDQRDANSKNVTANKNSAKYGFSVGKQKSSNPVYSFLSIYKDEHAWVNTTNFLWEPAVYGPGYDKVNDIVVHNPVSNQYAMIIQDPDDPEDQRTKDLLHSAAALLRTQSELETCPGNPGDCDYRTLHCTYGSETPLMSFDFNTGSKSDGVSEIEEMTPTLVVRNTGYNGDMFAFSSGFTLSTGTLEGDASAWVDCQGVRTQWDLDSIGIPVSRPTSISVKADVRFSESVWKSTTSIFAFDRVAFGVFKDGSVCYPAVFTDEGNVFVVKDKSAMVLLENAVRAGDFVSIGVDFSFASLAETKLRIGGASFNFVNLGKVTVNDTVAGSIDESFIGDSFSIGAWTLKNSVRLNSSVFGSLTADQFGFSSSKTIALDNLSITKLAGARSHTAACQTVEVVHASNNVYVKGDLAGEKIVRDYAPSDSVQEFIAPSDGDYTFELWGAGGGGDQVSTDAYSITGVHQAGSGGYTKVTYRLKAGQKIFLYVGEDSNSMAGGSGGGGNGSKGAYGGGGMTYIAAKDCGTVSNTAEGGGASTSSQFYNRRILCANSHAHGESCYSLSFSSVALNGGSGTTSVSGRTLSFGSGKVVFKGTWEPGLYGIAFKGSSSMEPTSVSVESSSVSILKDSFKRVVGSHSELQIAVSERVTDLTLSVTAASAGYNAVSISSFAGTVITGTNVKMEKKEVASFRGSSVVSGDYGIKYTHYTSHHGTVDSSIDSSPSYWYSAADFADSNPLGNGYGRAVKITGDFKADTTYYINTGLSGKKLYPHLPKMNGESVSGNTVNDSDNNSVPISFAFPYSLDSSGSLTFAIRVSADTDRIYFILTNDSGSFDPSSMPLVVTAVKWVEGEQSFTTHSSFQPTDFYDSVLAVAAGGGGASGSQAGGSVSKTTVGSAGGNHHRISSATELGSHGTGGKGGGGAGYYCGNAGYAGTNYVADAAQLNRIKSKYSATITLVNSYGYGTASAKMYSYATSREVSTQYSAGHVRITYKHSHGTDCKPKETIAVRHKHSSAECLSSLTATDSEASKELKTIYWNAARGDFNEMGLFLGSSIATENRGLMVGGESSWKVYDESKLELQTVSIAADAVQKFTVTVDRISTNRQLTAHWTVDGSDTVYTAVVTNPKKITVDGAEKYQFVFTVGGSDFSGWKGTITKLGFSSTIAIPKDPASVTVNPATGELDAFISSLDCKINWQGQVKVENVVVSDKTVIVVRYQSAFLTKFTTYEEFVAYVVENVDSIPMYVLGSKNVVTDCKVKMTEHVCGTDCSVIITQNCTEPHHSGNHYDFTSVVCWKACMNNENHKSTKLEATDSAGKNVKAATHVFLDKWFTLYYPNTGDFYDPPTAYDGYGSYGTGSDFDGKEHLSGIGALTHATGKGYYNDMDCTFWTKSKFVEYPFDVLYDDGTGLHTYMRGTKIPLDVQTEYFKFYCLLENDEAASAGVQFYSFAINSENDIKYEAKFNAGCTAKEYVQGHYTPSTEPSSSLIGGNSWYSIPEGESILNGFGGGETNLKDSFNPYDNRFSLTTVSPDKPALVWKRNKESFPYIHTFDTQNNDKFTNHLREEYYADFAAYPTAYKKQPTDVLGRIGNLIVVDTNDPVFSNFFKIPLKTGWQIDGVVRDVNSDLQNYYLSWFESSDGKRTPAYDIRGVKVSVGNHMYSTWNVQGWTEDSTAIQMPVLTTINRSSNNIGSKLVNKDLQPNTELARKIKQNDTVTELLQTKPLKLGYDILWEISTYGNYESVEIAPYYYLVDLATEGDTIPSDKLIPIDIYMRDASNIRPINRWGFFDTDSMESSRSLSDLINSESLGSDTGARQLIIATVKSKLTAEQITENQTIFDNFLLGESVQSIGANGQTVTTVNSEYATAKIRVSNLISDLAISFDDTGGELYDYAVYLDWVHEQGRRNYSNSFYSGFNEMTWTQRIYSYFHDYLNFPNFQIPYGDGYKLGNAQLISAGGRARTFIGSWITHAEDFRKDGTTVMAKKDAYYLQSEEQSHHSSDMEVIDWTDGTTLTGTHLSDSDTVDNSGNLELLGQYSAAQYSHAQRWHVKLALPSSTTPVPLGFDPSGKLVYDKSHTIYDKEVEYVFKDGSKKRIKAYEWCKQEENRYAILATVKIQSSGQVWYLGYNFGWGSGEETVSEPDYGNPPFIEISGKKVYLDGIPTVLGVYGTESSTEDVEIKQTH